MSSFRHGVSRATTSAAAKWQICGRGGIYRDNAVDHVVSNFASLLMVHRIKAPDKLRLAMLYALRYEDAGNLRAVKSRLLDSGLTPEKVDLVDALLQYAGTRST